MVYNASRMVEHHISMISMIENNYHLIQLLKASMIEIYNTRLTCRGQIVAGIQRETVRRRLKGYTPLSRSLLADRADAGRIE